MSTLAEIDQPTTRGSVRLIGSFLVEHGPGRAATPAGGLILTFGAPLVGHWSDKVGGRAS